MVKYILNENDKFPTWYHLQTPAQLEIVNNRNKMPLENRARPKITLTQNFRASAVFLWM